MAQNIREMDFMEAVNWVAQGGAVRRSGWPGHVRDMVVNKINGQNLSIRIRGLWMLFFRWHLDIHDVQANDWYLTELPRPGSK